MTTVAPANQVSLLDKARAKRMEVISVSGPAYAKGALVLSTIGCIVDAAAVITGRDPRRRNDTMTNKRRVIRALSVLVSGATNIAAIQSVSVATAMTDQELTKTRQAMSDSDISLQLVDLTVVAAAGLVMDYRRRKTASRLGKVMSMATLAQAVSIIASYASEARRRELSFTGVLRGAVNME